MIKIEETQRWCSGCGEKEGNKEIQVGLTRTHTSSVSLCADCRDELINKLLVSQ